MFPVKEFEKRFRERLNALDAIGEESGEETLDELNASYEDALFVMAGHSYELEVLGHWEYMEQLLQYICSFGFENLTTMEFVNRHYRR